MKASFSPHQPAYFRLAFSPFVRRTGVCGPVPFVSNAETSRRGAEHTGYWNVSSGSLTQTGLFTGTKKSTASGLETVPCQLAPARQVHRGFTR